MLAGFVSTASWPVLAVASCSQLYLAVASWFVACCFSSASQCSISRDNAVRLETDSDICALRYCIGTYIFGTYKNIWIIINTKNTHKYTTKPFAIDILDGYVLVAGNPAVYVLFYIVIMEVYGNFLVYFHDK